MTPAITATGGQAFGALYFDTVLPKDSDIQFSFTHDSIDGCYAVPAIIDEVKPSPWIVRAQSGRQD